MKKCAALLLLFLLLTACSRGPDPRALTGQVREKYSGGFAGSAEITADHGTRVFAFSLDFDLGPEGGALTLTAPEELSGITLSFDDGGAELSYGGVSVFTGHLTENGLSPAAALPMMVRSWREGAVTASEVTSEGLMLTYYVSDTVSLETVFDPETLEPCSAEVFSHGGRVLTCTFNTKE